MKALFTGSRKFSNIALIREVLNLIKPDCVIEGGATGADTIAYNLTKAAKAKGKAVRLETVKANWNRHGPAAGHRRNAAMIEMKPDVILAFFVSRTIDPKGCKGTKDCITQGIKAGIPTLFFGNSPTENGIPYLESLDKLCKGTPTILA